MARSSIFARYTAFYAAEGAFRRVEGALIDQFVNHLAHPSAIDAVTQAAFLTLFDVDGRYPSDIFARNTAFYTAEGRFRRIEDALVGHRIDRLRQASAIGAVL